MLHKAYNVLLPSCVVMEIMGNVVIKKLRKWCPEALFLTLIQSFKMITDCLKITQLDSHHTSKIVQLNNIPHNSASSYNNAKG